MDSFSCQRFHPQRCVTLSGGCRAFVLVLLVLPEAHVRSFVNAMAPRWRQLSSLTMWLPSSQIAVKVADTSLRNEQTVVSVTCVPLLILRRPCCLFPAHVTGLVKCGDLNLSGILDACAKSTLQPQNIASSTDVQVNSNDACAELESCS